MIEKPQPDKNRAAAKRGKELRDEDLERVSGGTTAAGTTSNIMKAQSDAGTSIAGNLKG